LVIVRIVVLWKSEKAKSKNCSFVPFNVFFVQLLYNEAVSVAIMGQRPCSRLNGSDETPYKLGIWVMFLSKLQVSNGKYRIYNQRAASFVVFSDLCNLNRTVYCPRMITWAFVYITKANDNAKNRFGRPIKIKIKLNVIICIVSAVGRVTVSEMCFIRTVRSSCGKTHFFLPKHSQLFRKQVWPVFIYYKKKTKRKTKNK
jgi:hypothetical protein